MVLPTFVSGFWLVDEGNEWWQRKNSHHNYRDSLDKLFSSLTNLHPDIRFVFLYNDNSLPMLSFNKYPRVTPINITSYYDWNRPVNFWVKLALVEVLWDKVGPYFWFDADCEFKEPVSQDDLAWISADKPAVAFHAVAPDVRTTYQQFGDKLLVTHETARERLEDLFGISSSALVTSAVHLMNSEEYARECGKINAETIKHGVTPYNDEWGHIIALHKMGIDLESNPAISLRTLWPKCIPFHHNVARFYGPGAY